MQGKVFTGPRITGGLILVALALAAWFMLRKPALDVDMATVSRGPMLVSIEDLGETRVHDLYTVSSPVTGQIVRIPFKPGAAVIGGKTVLAEVQPVQPDPLDRRSYAEIVATIGAREAQLSAAGAQVRQAVAAQNLAEATYRRYAALVGKGYVTRPQNDAARAELDRSRAASGAARQAQDAALHDLQAAQAAIKGGASAGSRGQSIRVVAPVSGTVLRVLQESSRPVVAGTQIAEIGNPTAIEIVSDMLSADAVKVAPGAPVEIDAWGGDVPLKGRVRLVEPYGFTKISALGVEEQRVNVIIDLVDPHAAWQRLGHGYRVTVRIALWSAPDVVRVPVGALFRQGADWAVFTVDARNRARLARVKLGHMNAEMAEVLGGIGPGINVILHPGEKVKAGVLVRARS